MNIHAIQIPSDVQREVDRCLKRLSKFKNDGKAELAAALIHFTVMTDVHRYGNDGIMPTREEGSERLKAHYNKWRDDITPCGNEVFTQEELEK